ncbi:MAG: ribonuclease domain-containing protein [Helcococcus sp.]|nr:ribonuclease domain-containing protein [Helcococcus sp.]
MNKKNTRAVIINLIILLLIAGIYYLFFVKNDNNYNKNDNINEIYTNESNEELKDKSKETISNNKLKNKVIKGEKYYTKNEVALYLHLFKELPPNYLTKSEAKDLGWDSSKGNLWDVTDKGVIGGDRFSNREGNLPQDKYFEADVNYEGGYRGAERLIYTKGGKVIYYTGDHYKNFELLYE